MLSAICFSLLLAVTSPVIATEYRYISIPTPPWYGLQDIGNPDINDNGEVVGIISLVIGLPETFGLDFTKGFLYRGGIFITRLRPPGWPMAYPKHINNRGEVIGYGYKKISDEYRGGTKGFLFNGWIYTELLPPGWQTAIATDINDSGTVIGNGFDGITRKVFIYSGGTYTELLPPGWQWSEAVAINASGTVIGNGYDSTGTAKGFIYSGGTYAELLPPGWTSSFVNAINDSGEVIGNQSEKVMITKKGFSTVRVPTLN